MVEAIVGTIIGFILSNLMYSVFFPSYSILNRLSINIYFLIQGISIKYFVRRYFTRSHKTPSPLPFESTLPSKEPSPADSKDAV